MRPSRALVITAAAALSAAALILVFVRLHDGEPAAVLSASGELVTFEMSSGTLTLRTTGGDQHFVVLGDTPVHEGARTIPLADLTSASGCRGKVWYRDSQGRGTAEEIRIACGEIVPPEAAPGPDSGPR